MIGSKPLVANLIAQIVIRLTKLPFGGMCKTAGVVFLGKIFLVRRFPIMATIQAQTWGDHIFLRQDIGSGSPLGLIVVRHELKHVEQFHRYGFWGLGFLLRYWLQFLWYTRGMPFRIPWAIQNMPLEKEAYDFQKTTS